MGRAPGLQPTDGYGGSSISRGSLLTLASAMAVIILCATGLVLQLGAAQQRSSATHHVQHPSMLGLHNYTAQIQRLTALTEQLQQKVDDMDTKSMERMHSAISSTRQAVSDVREAVQRVFTHTNSTGGKLDTLLSKSGIVNLGTTAAAPVGSAAASASPSPAPRVKRLVVSMSSFPGRAELAIPTVYSIMYGKRVPDALYFWVAVNVSRLPGHDAAQEVPGPVKSVADQFKSGGVLKVLVPSKDYGPATKLLPTLQAEQDPETVIVTIDDDTYYHQDTVYDLEQEMIRRKGHAVVRSCEETFRDTSVTPAKTWRTWKLDEGRCNGFMTAYASAAYRRAFFDDAVFQQELAPEACLHHDDVWFSGHLWIRQVPIWILRPHVHAWPPMYHRPPNKLSISAHPEAQPKILQCLDYFGWLSSNSSDIRSKLLGHRKPYAVQ